MAVIVREERRIGDGIVPGIAVYQSSRPVGTAARAQAQRLDLELGARMRWVTEEVRRDGWLALKGRPGVVRLWWEVGRRLRGFADDLDVGPEEDRQFLWRAMYDHAGDLVPGKVGARAGRHLNSHFYYCYLLGRYDWQTVEAFGDWTSWVEIFDSLRLRDDPRVIDWLAARAGSNQPGWREYVGTNRMGWFRPLAKAIRARFANRDSRGLSIPELEAELDAVFDELVSRGREQAAEPSQGT